jgi:hypothetical protein
MSAQLTTTYRADTIGAAPMLMLLLVLILTALGVIAHAAFV